MPDAPQGPSVPSMPSTPSAPRGPTSRDATSHAPTSHDPWTAWSDEPMRRRLVAFAARYVGDAWEAEDVVQETLLRARESLPTLRAKDRGEAWLFRICRHAAIDHVRARRVRRAVWTPLSPEVEAAQVGEAAGFRAAADDGAFQPGPPTMPPGPAHAAEAPGVAARGHAASLPLRALPAHQRVLVSLHYERGLSQAVLCRMTGLTASALRVRLFRARNALVAEVRRRRGGR